MVWSNDRENEGADTAGCLFQWERFACVYAYVFIWLITMASLCSMYSKGIYEIFTGKKCEVGVQTERLPDTDIVRYAVHVLQCLTLDLFPPQVVYVMPSTSGRAASHPRRVDKLKFFYELKELRDRLKLQHGRIATKDAAYSQLGTANEQPPDSDHTPKG